MRCATGSDGSTASGVTPARWYIAIEPKLAIAAPKCLSSSEVGHALEALEVRHRPVVAGETSDHAAERAPLVQGLGVEVTLESSGWRGGYPSR